MIENAVRARARSGLCREAVGVKAPRPPLGGPACPTLTPPHPEPADAAWWRWSRGGTDVRGGRGRLERGEVDGPYVGLALAGGESRRASFARLPSRTGSSRPRSRPSKLSGADHDRVCEVRRRTGWGPRLIPPRRASRTPPSTRAGPPRSLATPLERPGRPSTATSGRPRATCLHMYTKRHARVRDVLGHDRLAAFPRAPARAPRRRPLPSRSSVRRPPRPSSRSSPRARKRRSRILNDDDDVGALNLH